MNFDAIMQRGIIVPTSRPMDFSLPKTCWIMEACSQECFKDFVCYTCSWKLNTPIIAVLHSSYVYNERRHNHKQSIWIFSFYDIMIGSYSDNMIWSYTHMVLLRYDDIRLYDMLWKHHYHHMSQSCGTFKAIKVLIKTSWQNRLPSWSQIWGRVFHSEK